MSASQIGGGFVKEQAVDSGSENGTGPDPLCHGDAPILFRTDDRLGRSAFAEALAAEALTVPAARGYVMGLTGPWGSGKTSVLNMMTDAMDDRALIIEFNPWLFSGTDALVRSFFEELSKQLKTGDNSVLVAIADKLASYGHLLSPIAVLVGAGGAVDAATGVLERLTAKPSVVEQRRDLCRDLGDLNKRLVVIIDDVDRLRPEEIRDLVRLVRLVGDFPNTVYVLAFDRQRVEECLGEGDLDRGRSYLEKIVQVIHDLPRALPPDTTQMFLDGLRPLVEAVPVGPLSEADWQNIFFAVVQPLLKYPRNVRRLLASLSMTLRIVGTEIALADLVGIEAVRVLHPAMFETILKVQPFLFARPRFRGGINVSGFGDAATNPVEPLDAIDKDLARSICTWLFPASRRYFDNTWFDEPWEVLWRWDRKVASESVFRFYMERHLPQGVVPARTVWETFAQLTEPDRLQETLGTLSSDELLDLLERLNPGVEGPSFDVTHMGSNAAAMAIPVFLGLVARLPAEQGHLAVSRVVLRLLKRVEEAHRKSVITTVLHADIPMSGQWLLVELVGHRQGGHQLVDADTASRLERRCRLAIQKAGAGSMMGEVYLLELINLLVETSGGRRALRKWAHQNDFLLALLANSKRRSRAQSVGAFAVQVTDVLPWANLVHILGERFLGFRMRQLQKAVQAGEVTVSKQDEDVISLAVGYLKGDHQEGIGVAAWSFDPAHQGEQQRNDGEAEHENDVRDAQGPSPLEKDATSS